MTQQLPNTDRRRIIAFSAAIVSLSLVTTAATGTSDERRPPTPTPPPALNTPEMDLIRPGLAPLLREGSQIQNVRGSLYEHQPTATWRFVVRHPETDRQSQGRREFIVLPNTHLGEMQQVISSAPERSLTFRITGEVFIYDGRNYLLISFPPRVISEEQPAAVEPGEGEADTEDGRQRDRSATDIMRDLEREAGAIGRTPGAPPRDRDRVRTSRQADQKLVPENTNIHLRRGRIGRDAGGAWQFIFDSDASGRQDPPMTLMPCLLLTQIERYARRAGSNAPVLLSGRVFVHQGRNYLLPTVFQIPREQTFLNP